MLISIILQALTGTFETDLARASKTTQKRMNEIQRDAARAGKVIGAALAAGATAAAVAIKSAINRADELSKTAQKIGIPTEALSRLAYAAELADVPLEALQSSLAKMVKAQFAAAQGNKEAIATFESFGIAIKDNAGNLRNSQDVLEDFAEVFQDLPDGPEKTALALRVFGKSGAELIPLLNGGAEGMKALADEADRLGITISTEAGIQAEAFNDQLTTLKTTLVGVATQVALQLLPTLQELAREMQNGAEEAGDFEGFAQGLVEVFGFVVRLGADVANTIRGIVSVVIALGNATAGLQAAQNLNAAEFQKRMKLAKQEFEEAGERFTTFSSFGQGSDAAPTGGVNRPGGPIEFIDPPAYNAATANVRKLIAAQEESRRKAEEAAKARQGAAKAESEAARAAAEAERERVKRLQESQEEADRAAEATIEFTRALEDLEAQQAGPLKEAELEHNRRVAEIRDLWSKGAAPAAAELTRALEALGAEYASNVEEIRKGLNPGEERLKQLREEIRILGMKTQAERDAAQFKNENRNASDEMADEYARLLAERDVIDQRIAANDELRESFEANFAAVLTGAKSAKEAFSDFVDGIINQLAKLVSQNIGNALFGNPGTMGGGIFGSLFSEGGLFGGFFASGTNFAPGGLSIVGEQGPELVSLPKGSKVIPNHALQKMGGKTIAPTINIAVPGNTTKETAQQIAMKVREAVTFAGRAA